MRLKRRRQFEAWLGTAALTGAHRWLSGKQPERYERIGSFCGRLIYRLSSKHRNRTLRNLEMAFPEMSSKQREELAVSVLEHFGKMTADFLASKNRTKEQLLDSVVVEGKEHFDQALEKGKGAILITGHFGNWERLGNWMSAVGYPLTVIARDTNSGKMTEIVNSIRAYTGTKILSRGQAARGVLERLRANEIVGILPDQNAEDVFVPFFGAPAGTVLGPGVFADRTGAAVIPAYCIWIGPNQYKIVIKPPLKAHEGYSTKGEGVMRAINQSLEEIVREYPDQWLWLHDRWKSARKRGLIS